LTDSSACWRSASTAQVIPCGVGNTPTVWWVSEAESRCHRSRQILVRVAACGLSGTASCAQRRHGARDDRRQVQRFFARRIAADVASDRRSRAQLQAHESDPIAHSVTATPPRQPNGRTQDVLAILALLALDGPHPTHCSRSTLTQADARKEWCASTHARPVWPSKVVARGAVLLFQSSRHTQTPYPEQRRGGLRQPASARSEPARHIDRWQLHGVVG